MTWAHCYYIQSFYLHPNKVPVPLRPNCVLLTCAAEPVPCVRKRWGLLLLKISIKLSFLWFYEDLIISYSVL